MQQPQYPAQPPMGKDPNQQEAQPMLVYGVPVSGLDGQPTQLVIRGEAVDMPSKFNDKSTRYTDIGYGIAFWITIIAFIGIIVYDGCQEQPSNGYEKIMSHMKMPAATTIVHLCGSIGIGAVMMWIFISTIKYKPSFVVWFAMLIGWLVFLVSAAGLFFHATFVYDQMNAAFKNIDLDDAFSQLNRRNRVTSGSTGSTNLDRGLALMIQLVLEIFIGASLFISGIFYMFFSCCACCCCGSTLQLTIKLFKAAGVVLDKYKCTLGVAFATACLSKVFIMTWIGATISAIDLVGANVSRYDGQFGCQVAAFFGMLLIFFWFLGVCSNVAHVTYCKIVAHWYFNSDREAHFSVQRMSTFKAFGSAITIHFGTICLGSLLVAIIQTLQVICAVAKNQAENGENEIVQLICLLIYAILRVLLSMIEDIVEFFNKIAYCHVATYNTNFCESVKSTMKLLMASGMKLMVNDHWTATVLNLWMLLLMYPLFLYMWATTHGPMQLIPAEQVATVGNTCVFVVEIGLGFMFLLNAGAMLESAVLQLFVCYAEHPETLNVTHPEIAREFAKATYNYLESMEGGKDDFKPSNDVMGNTQNANEGSALNNYGQTGHNYGGAPVQNPPVQPVVQPYGQPQQPQYAPGPPQQPQQYYGGAVPAQQQGAPVYTGQPQQGVPTGMPVQNQGPY